MKYTNIADKEKIRKAIKLFLVEKGFSLRKFCVDSDLDYSGEYQKLFRGHVNHDDVVLIVKKIDPTYTLVRYGSAGSETYKIMKG